MAAPVAGLRRLVKLFLKSQAFFAEKIGEVKKKA